MMMNLTDRKHSQRLAAATTSWPFYAVVSGAMQPIGCPESFELVGRLNLAGQVTMQGMIQDRQNKT
jgi:hypothetical protein